jgi:hypothetical protein
LESAAVRSPLRAGRAKTDDRIVFRGGQSVGWIEFVRAVALPSPRAQIGRLPTA